MNISFPIHGIVKKGGSDHIRKIYFPDQKDWWLANKDPDKILLHINRDTFSSPTTAEWKTYHSFNNSETLSKWLNDNGFKLDDNLEFICVVDCNDIVHLLRCK